MFLGFSQVTHTDCEKSFTYKKKLQYFKGHLPSVDVISVVIKSEIVMSTQVYI